MRFLACIIGCAVAIPDAAAAQTAPDFSMLRLKVGDTIYVTDLETGVEVSGALKTLTAAGLSINGYSFTPGSGLTIERAGEVAAAGAAGIAAIGLFLPARGPLPAAVDGVRLQFDSARAAF